MSTTAHAQEQTRIAIAVDPEGLTCVLGGGLNGAFVNAEKISTHFKPRQNFKLYNMRGSINSVLWPIGSPEKVNDDTCQPHTRQKLSLAASELGKYHVAIHDSSGNKRIAILPKTLQAMSIDSEKYVAILATHLEKQNMENAPVKIHQLIRTDLDGDGKFEVIINAINTAHETDRKGEYSIVLLVREDGDKPIVEVIQNEITPEDSDLPVALWENTITAIVDIDGDGHMEIIMHGQFFHGQGWDLVRRENLTSERPVLCGCGG